jgi:hypothetical protein
MVIKKDVVPLAAPPQAYLAMALLRLAVTKMRCWPLWHRTVRPLFVWTPRFGSIMSVVL